MMTMVLVLFVLVLLCSCTVTVAPLEPKTRIHRTVATAAVRRHPSTHFKTGVIGQGSNGTTRVDATWLHEYRKLEHKYGDYRGDNEEIKQTDEDGVFSIGYGVSAHYADMKRMQLESHASPTP